MTVIDTHSPVVAEEPPPVDEFVAGVLPRTYLSALEMHTRERARAILHARSGSLTSSPRQTCPSSACAFTTGATATTDEPD